MKRIAIILAVTFSFCYYQTNGQIPTPTLSSPANGSTFDVGSTIGFFWSYIPNITSYDIEFDTGQSFVFTKNLSSSNYFITADAASIGTHTWRVRAKNGNIIGPWSASGTYTINPLAAPRLSTPANGSSFDIASTIVLSWSYIPGTTSYDIEFDEGTTYSILSNSSTNFYSWRIEPESVGTHTWRVRARSETITGSWSDKGTYTVNPPGIPILALPADGTAFDVGATLLLSWNYIPGATSYDIEFDTGKSYSDTINSSTYIISIRIGSESIGTHTWRVRSRSGTIIGSWSSPRSYKVNGLEAPTLSSPSNGSAFDVGSIKNFSWSSVPGALGYDIEFDPGKSYAEIIHSPINFFTLMIKPVSIGSHTWHVRAKNGTVTSLWSTLGNYTVNSPGIPTLTSPANGTILEINSISNFSWSSIPGATSYEIEFDTGQSYADLRVSSINFLPLLINVNSAGSHTWRVRAICGATTGNWSDKGSYTVTQTGSILQVQVLNIDTPSPIPGANGLIKFFDSKNTLLDQQPTVDGTAIFRGLPVGSGYYYQVFYNPSNLSDPFGQEYWGSQTGIKISSNPIVSIFKRDQPYCGTIKLYKGDLEVTGQSIAPNTEIRIVQEIINPSNIVRQARAKIQLAVNSQTVNFLTETSFNSIPANGKITQEWKLTPNTIGAYFVSGGVETKINGKLIITDGQSRLHDALFKIRKAGDKITKYYAIIVGNGLDANDFRANLLTRSNTEYLISTLLNNPGLWSADRVVTLVNEQVSMATIENSFMEISKIIDDDDFLLFYYTGHGHPLGLVLYGNYAFPPEYLMLYLKNYLPEMTKAVISLDACSSGIFTDYLKTKARINQARLNTAIIAATAINEQTPQLGFDGINEITHSPYTYLFCQAIRGVADTNYDGLVTVQETFNYLAPALSNANWVSNFINGSLTPQFAFTAGANNIVLNLGIMMPPNAPIVYSSYPTGLTSNGVSSGGTITLGANMPKSATIGNSINMNAASSILAKGVCWSTSANPTVDLLTKTVDNADTLNYSSNITGLIPGTTYHLRAYATTSTGTYYGEDLEFTTYQTNTAPIISTDNTSSTELTNTICQSTILFNGDSEITLKGFCWGTSENPTIDDEFIPIEGVGTGTFSGTITGLSEGTTYHVRAFATNNNGTSYGQDVVFKTNTSVELPTITSNPITTIEGTTANCGGTILADGGAPILEKGVCWNTDPNPTADLITRTIYGTGIGKFTSTIYGLSGGTTYYVRAYATNNIGTSYGNEVSFKTAAVPPSLTTTDISAITSLSATTGGIITADGGAAITQRGVCWSTASDPTINNSKSSDGLGIGTFISNITGIVPGSKYYVRSYATNSAGTDYGQNVSFNTLPLSPTIGIITQPTCTQSNGSVLLNGLPASGSWTLTRTPGGTTTTGTGTETTLTGIDTGTYTYTLTDVWGSTSVASENVVINPQPVTPATPVITMNGTTLHSNSANGNQWYNSTGALAGETNQDFSPKSTGDYYVVVTLNGCSSEKSIINIVTGSVQFDYIKKITVYPNPVSDDLTIEYSGNFEAVKFKIVNLTGQVIYDGKLLDKTIVNISSFTPGLYFIKFDVGKTYEFRKVIKN